MPRAVAVAVGLLLLPIPTVTSAIPDEARVVADWIVALQLDRDPRSRGGLLIHPTPGHVDPSTGVPYYRVSAYSASLAVSGLLASNHPERFSVAEGWIRWFTSHFLASGLPHRFVPDHWYRADGSGETTCPPGLAPSLCGHEDASDSTAGTFLAAVAAYAEAGGARSRNFLPPHRTALRAVADALLTLQDGDGLTWARGDYRVKYVMDNSEVHAGLAGWARVEGSVFADAGRAERFAQAAAAVAEGIHLRLFDRATCRYHVARDALGAVTPSNLAEWYPGTVAVVWPHLFHVPPAPGAIAAVESGKLTAAWDGSPRGDWTRTVVDPAGFLWPSVGHAALLAGDPARADAHARFVIEQRFPRGGGAGFEWPFTADDAGWLLRTLAAPRGAAAQAPPPVAGSACGG